MYLVSYTSKTNYVNGRRNEILVAKNIYSKNKKVVILSGSDVEENFYFKVTNDFSKSFRNKYLFQIKLEYIIMKIMRML